MPEIFGLARISHVWLSLIGPSKIDKILFKFGIKDSNPIGSDKF